MSNYRRKELAKKITASLLLLSFSSQPYFSTAVFANTNTTVSAPAAGQQVNSQIKYRNLRLRIPVSALTKLQLQIL